MQHRHSSRNCFKWRLDDRGRKSGYEEVSGYHTPLFSLQLTTQLRVDFIVMPMLMAIYFTFQLDRANM